MSTKIHSTVTELPASCKASAERMARELAKEDFAEITESCRIQITELEHTLSKELGENIALVAFRV